LRYQIERKLVAADASYLDLYGEAPAGEDWRIIASAESERHPQSFGLVGSRYGEQVRVTTKGVTVALYEWAPTVPVNPGDIQCTDFLPGWKLVRRQAGPVPSGDELAHFFVQ
jgi:hypothetical protein